MLLFLFFFFQAEDGIRDTSETGVQTCALPIYTGETGIGHYRRNVRVTGEDFEMSAGTLQFLLPVKQRQLQGLTVEENVLVRSGDLRAQGQQVTYSPDTGLIRVTGQPTWQAALREGRGDELEIDRTN